MYSNKIEGCQERSQENESVVICHQRGMTQHTQRNSQTHMQINPDEHQSYFKKNRIVFTLLNFHIDKI